MRDVATVELGSAPRLGIVGHDDADDIVDALVLLASMLGHEARGYPGAQGILRDLAAFDPDVVFCDLHMPKVTRFMFAELMRAEPSLAHVYLIAHSALTGGGVTALALKSGFDDFCAKPAMPEDIEAGIRKGATVSEQRAGQGFAVVRH